VSVETVISLIGSTTTTTGLKVICRRDNNVYELAKTVTDEDYKPINMKTIAPFDNWNYIFKSK
jgi:hypothetical protein